MGDADHRLGEPLWTSEGGGVQVDQINRQFIGQGSDAGGGAVQRLCVHGGPVQRQTRIDQGEA